MAVTDGIMLLGSELGFGVNAFVGGLVGIHLLALVCSFITLPQS
ncbi:uncharacterized protein PITG_04566 [Phytophthora infestans T30-4]|uniref:Uncharacterized protein n=1 Tax=Phytophthora infestans (strain T30-4) TaxID=403677 RepID=D0N1I8_PHYIT|nr:uncharacterized protein PITG_04566 [Phytophthora infestans T30-4]EEY68167.1 hypothetical protein PITG_04566 [Phytophthora infestans T30-4]|eukprot:XP_002905326.1 hypothetical protein PITG_04566 [Phytophthora infestans T30-4]